MRIKTSSFLLISLHTFLCFGQADVQKDFTINDVVLGIYSRFYPEDLYNLQWQNDAFYTFNRYHFLVQKKVGEKDEKVLLSLDKLNEKLKENHFQVVNYMPQVKWKDSVNFWFVHKNTLLVYNLEEHDISSIIKFDDATLDHSVSPDLENVAFVVDSNVYVKNKDGIISTITNDSIDGFVNGLDVHRKEFGIKNGLFWSPKGNKLAFYHKNESRVTTYPLVDVELPIASTKYTKYPMAGSTSENVKVGIYNSRSDTVVYLQTIGAIDDYLTNITWSPDEDFIYVAELNRDQDHLQFNKFNVTTGAFVKTVFEEQHEKYVEPQFPAQFLNNDASRFIWQSQQDGYNHLYLYDTTGAMLKQLTRGNWMVTDVLGIDPGNNAVYYISTEETPLERHVYKINLNTGKTSKISDDAGIHEPTFNHSFTLCIDNHNSKKVPRRIVVIDNEGNELEELLVAENPIKDYKLGKTTTSAIKAADGVTDLYYKMVLPDDFSPRKKYPVIVYVYGGPHNQLVLNEWPKRIEMWLYYMAQQGYIGFMLDNRGSEGRGLEFENATFRNLGYEERADQMEGIEFLSKMKYVDTSRIGVFGWSYGGYMATSLMLHHPSVFKVGVAGGPVIDWALYEVMYTERYMDTPETNPTGYQNTNLLNYAENLRGNLLLIHGAMDPVVVMQQSLLFIRKCIELNIPVDYFVYPTHEHNVKGKDRLHLMNKVSNYIIDNL